MNPNKSTAKAKLNTDLGVIEIEGTEEFVKSAIPDLVRHIQAQNIEQADSYEVEKTSKKAKSSSKAVISPKLIADLIPKDKINDLRNFFIEKSPANHQEAYTVLAYWMKYNLDIKDVSIDEIWTAHKILSRRGPDNWLQVFRDIKSKKGYLDSSTQEGKYYISSLGETLVEHDLPKKNSQN